MIEKIKKLFKTYQSLTKTYHPSLLASAIVFYILMVILPLGGLVLYLLGKLSIEVEGYPNLSVPYNPPASASYQALFCFLTFCGFLRNLPIL